MPHIFDTLGRLSDEDVVAAAQRAAAAGRGITAALVAHLAEIETRALHLARGFGSLFAYCREALALSEYDAFHAVEAARAVRRFPCALARLEDGSVSLTTLRILAPHLTEATADALLQAARGKRKIEVEEIAARLLPRPDVPASVRKLPDPRPGEPPPVQALTPPAALLPGEESAPPAPAVARPRFDPPPMPIAPYRYRLQLTIASETLQKLRLAKDMLAHALPTADDAAILDRALDALLVELARKKFAYTDAPRAAREAAPDSRHVAADVKREVWVRDLGRCAFVAPGGRRCEQQRGLEFHHVKPFAAGGAATAENIQLRCRAHNGYEARAYFRPESLGPSNASGSGS